MRGFWAALMLFTRLPLGRVLHVEKHDFEQAIRYWPLVGFLTGGTTALVLWSASFVLPWGVAVALAMVARLLLTGALHEDGLADFLDGFGGGTTRERILAIMKDSHIGSYGTIGLILYFLLYHALLSALPLVVAPAVIVSADCFSKYAAAVLTNTLPYVRKEEESKVRLQYNKIPLCVLLWVGVCVLLPSCFVGETRLHGAFLPAVLMAFGLWHFLKAKIGGYTGDCCGASVLLIELVYYLGVVALWAVN